MRALAFRLARPLLHRLDPETAHDLTLKALAGLPVTRAGVPPGLSTDLFGLRFASPLGLAAGFDKNAIAFRALLGLGLGFVEVGTLTPQPQTGNPRPRLFRLGRDRAVINRFGFNNDGHAPALARLRAWREAGGTGIVGVNVGANKASTDRAADYAAGITAFAEVASYFTLNISSPNTPGLRDLQHRDALDDLLARALEARDAAPFHRPVLVKIAPDVTEADLDDIVAVALNRGVDGLIISNTTVARPSGLAETALAKEAGGLSGAPLFAPSTRVLARAFMRCGGRLPLVGVGGIATSADALEKIRAGASLLQVYSALVYHGPALVAEINDALAARPEWRRQIGAEAGRWAPL